MNNLNREKFLNELKRSGEVNITVTGRKTKKKLSTPVWFVLEGEKVMLVPMKGSDSNWFKNLVNNQQIELGINDDAITCNARIVRNSDQTKQVIDRLRTKYKSEWAESYYTKRDAYVQVSM